MIKGILIYSGREQHNVILIPANESRIKRIRVYYAPIQKNRGLRILRKPLLKVVVMRRIWLLLSPLNPSRRSGVDNP